MVEIKLKSKTFLLAAFFVVVSLGCIFFFNLHIYNFFIHILGQELQNSEEPNQNLMSVSKQKDTVTLYAVGDIMLARKVGRLLAGNGWVYPLQYLGPELAKADLTFANLESPIAQSGKPLPGKQICFRAEPAAVECLKYGGFDLVSLANNHALDYDSPALLETIDLLNQQGIKVVGAGANIQGARQPVIIEKNGVKIGFLAYSDLADIYFSHSYPRAHQATETLPGVAPLILTDMLEDVKSLRQQVDVLAVSLHWGVEYRDEPLKKQQEMAHQLVDAGVDLIIGHHPHWFQGLEVYQGKLIAYSLGNFIFDQNWSESTREGLVLQVILDSEGLRQARVRPVFIFESQPRWATEARQQKLLKRIIVLCQKLGTISKVEGDWITISLPNAGLRG